MYSQIIIEIYLWFTIMIEIINDIDTNGNNFFKTIQSNKVILFCFLLREIAILPDAIKINNSKIIFMEMTIRNYFHV